MPARLTRARARRNDENPVPATSKAKALVNKAARAPLADRTNSASDENTSGQDAAKKPPKKEESARPRRAQRLPARLADHLVAITLPSPPQPLSKVEPRPRREQRLPSRFSDHSISPSKFVPLTSGSASTPLPNQKKVPESRITNRKATGSKKVAANISSKTKVKQQADTNNNPREKELCSLTENKTIETVKEAVEPCSPKRQIPIKTLNKSPVSRESRIFKTTGRVYSPKSQSKGAESPKIKEKLAIYEFTFDPNEEPKIPKKNRKKQPVRKKAAPRRVFIKDNYTKNVAKQLESLKEIIANKASSNNATTLAVPSMQVAQSQKVTIPKTKNKEVSSTQMAQPQNVIPPTTTYKGCDVTEQPNNTPDQVIIEPIEEGNHFDDISICYSPVPDPVSNVPTSSKEMFMNPNSARQKDPLNLIDDFSFFDDVPLASSSIRKSVAASPWRVDCNTQSKWPVNMYVKPNMTPAYESSFKNVDIDYAPKSTENPAQSGLFTDQNEPGGLKQTSILSFIKEVAEKKAKKKVSTPIKNNSVFDLSHSLSDTSHPSADQPRISSENTPEENSLTRQAAPKPQDTMGCTDYPLENVLGSRDTLEKVFVTPEKPVSPKNIDKKDSNKYFGFDDSEDLDDRENVSPKKNGKIKGRVLRSRPVLRDLNQQRPMRLTAPIRPFAPTSEVVVKLYEKTKSLKEIPIELPIASNEKSEKSETSENSLEMSGEVSVDGAKEKSPSPVGLFQDVEVVHYVKPFRKSYGKARKVTFQQTTTTVVSDAEASDASSGDDNMKESGFVVPKVRQKKAVKRKKKVQKMTKKESEEAEAWMAGFNSMVEEIDEFPLVVE